MSVDVRYTPFETEERKATSILNSKLCAYVIFGCALVMICVYVIDGKRSTTNLNYIVAPVVEFQHKTNDLRWTYDCIKGKCVRERYKSGSPTSLKTCNMICGKAQIWPIPTSTFITSSEHVSFFQEQLAFVVEADEPAKLMLYEAFGIFLDNLSKITESQPQINQISEINNITVAIEITNSQQTKLQLETNEDYNLRINKNINNDLIVRITSQTYFGARHALETLLQLIWWDEFAQNGMLQILTKVSIKDGPRYPYRGLMVDTARNFFPIEQLKQVVQGMSASKLNTFHLHLTDATSFPIKLPHVAKMAEYGAYHPDMVYTSEDIQDLVQYANIRGVRVVLEVDAPSHVRSGWEWGEAEDYGKLVICNQKISEGGVLNPDEPKALDVLQNIYGDLLTLSQEQQIFHIGGDEVDADCWKGTNASKNFTSMNHLWANYTGRMLERLRAANGGVLPENIVMWSSHLTASSSLEEIPDSKNIVVQFWLGNPTSFLANKHKVIFSTVGHWYLDCGFGMWNPQMGVGNCDPYTPWQKFYKYRPWQEYNSGKLTLGGEVCLWSEQVSPDDLHTRLWPRTTAFAERVWSDPSEYIDYEVYTRLATQSERIKRRGLGTAAMWPMWCTLNPESC